MAVGTDRGGHHAPRGGAAVPPATDVRVPDLLDPVLVDGPDARRGRPDTGAEGILQLARCPRGQHRGVHPPAPGSTGGVPAGDLIKRVIALPGQTIYSAGNSIYVNGHLLAEPYLPAYDPLGPAIASSQHPYRVPPGDFYVLGDNRADSCDSRYWGPIQGSSIVGKAILVIWHDNHPDVHRL